MKRQTQTQIRINASADVIINALTDPEELKNWWGVNSSFIEAKDGGLYILSWLKSDAGIKFILTAKIRLLNKRSHLYLEDLLYINAERPILGPTLLKIDIASRETYSIVSLVHSAFEKDQNWDWYFELMSDSWPQALVFLKQYLENT